MSAPLPIRERLTALRGLKHPARAVLIEVCQLTENGERRRFDATNDHLAGVIGGGASERTAKRAVAALVTSGLVLTNGATKARVLLPAPAVRACYLGTDAEQQRAVGALEKALIRATIRDTKPDAIRDTTRDNSTDSGHDSAPSIRDKSGTDSGQIGYPFGTNPVSIRDKSGRAYKETPSTTSYSQDPQEVASLRAALAQTEDELIDARQTIAELKTELADLKASTATEIVPPVAPPPTAPIAKGHARRTPKAEPTGPAPHVATMEVWQAWYTKRFGAPVVGAKHWVAAKSLHDGLKAAFLTDEAATAELAAVLAAWDAYPAFNRQLTDLTQIAQRINELRGLKGAPVNPANPRYGAATAAAPVSQVQQRTTVASNAAANLQAKAAARVAAATGQPLTPAPAAGFPDFKQ